MNKMEGKKKHEYKEINDGLSVVTGMYVCVREGGKNQKHKRENKRKSNQTQTQAGELWLEMAEVEVWN
jgi:hypothetical protein